MLAARGEGGEEAKKKERKREGADRRVAYSTVETRAATPAPPRSHPTAVRGLPGTEGKEGSTV